MKKVTLDTNIIISAIFWQSEAERLMLLSEEKEIQIFASEQILQEVKDVIMLEKFQKILVNKNQSNEDLINSLLDKVTIIEINTQVDLIKEHEPDNRILECAISSMSEYLISYNKHILIHKKEIKELFNIEVLHPTEFLRLFD